ncbi:uncharacterized protein LOC120258183 [Dioscorea cayenensis subsp. rotundata]|uniref:Uncharacterized protein LOC120258183 n=1 Tax=Dioscorea cayennensis subsp. rotundata TaxID=55577 RepID=A0AB40B2F8_DIOCR|nr:uncharacterized protein LOC120258183 [Dioscorea cayenensis subsp. rotundata]XP_039121475.1 uncharacterized protein LOC120258183 [Dioscorea cayenensis subsp. rotundata]
MAMEEMVPWEEIWRCRKHPSRLRPGICALCLRDRLLLLCPDCSHVRPCKCAPSASSSSSSFSSFCSVDLLRSGSVSGIGAIGRVSNLIESEPALPRSRSVAIPFTRSRSVAEDKQPVRKGWMSVFWPFWRSAGRAPSEAPPEKLSRSRTVGVGEAASKSKGWHFPSPMKAFRHRKTAKVLQEQRSPLCRG